MIKNREREKEMCKNTTLLKEILKIVIFQIIKNSKIQKFQRNFNNIIDTNIKYSALYIGISLKNIIMCILKIYNIHIN